MLDDPYNPIPISLAFEFINATCQAEGIEDIGLLAGRAASVQMMDEFGKRLLGSKNIGDYLKLGCRLINAVSSSEDCVFWRIRSSVPVDSDHLIAPTRRVG